MFYIFCWCIKMEAPALRGDTFLEGGQRGLLYKYLDIRVSWNLMALNIHLKGGKFVRVFLGVSM